MKKLCGFIAMALCVVACNKINEKNVQPEGMPFSATIRIDDGAVTKALSEDGTTLVASWAAGEKVGLVHGVVDEMTVTPNGDGTATISGTITNSPADGAPVTIVYPASAADLSGIKPGLLKVQNGLLTGEGSISKNYDVRVGSGTFKVDGEKVTLSETVSLTNQNAIIKFSIGSKTIDSNLPFYILNGNNEIITTVIPSSPGAVSTFYVAMAPVTGGSFKFVLGESDGYKYYQTKTTTIAAGKYYQSPLTGWYYQGPHAISSSSVTAADIGSVIASDGKIYFNSYAATHQGTTPLAMIAYVGNASECAKGLAIALEDVSSSEYKWADAPGAVTNWATGKAVSGGTWRLPSIKDWQYMFIGCGASGSYSDNPSSMSYSGLESMLNMAQGTALGSYYWSATVYTPDTSAWDPHFDKGIAYFYSASKNNEYNVRACLAF